MFLDAVFRGRSQEKKSKSFSEELLKVYVESNTDVYSSRCVFFNIFLDTSRCLVLCMAFSLTIRFAALSMTKKDSHPDRGRGEMLK